MKLCDCHIHMKGGEDGKEFLRDMDKAGLDRAVILAPYRGDSIRRQRESTDEVLRFAAADRRRIRPFAFIEPRLKKAPDEVKRAKDRGAAGIKMMPNHWYPCDEKIFPVYAAIEETGLPVLFHSGILWAFMDSSRFCRPVYYEALLNFPRLRFALAHISWPWTDECLAVAGRFRAAAKRGEVAGWNDGEYQMWVDITPGAHRPWREDALRKALSYIGDGRLIFGSDCTVSSLAWLKDVRAEDEAIFRELKVPKASQRRIFAANLDAFLGER